MLLTLHTLAIPMIVQTQENKLVIVLSPGHGCNVDGKIDNGASNGELVEKDINLDVARYTRDYLSRCPVEAYLTRNGDDLDHTKYDIDEIVNGY